MGGFGNAFALDMPFWQWAQTYLCCRDSPGLHVTASSHSAAWTGSSLGIHGRSLEAVGRREVMEPGFTPRGSARVGAKPSSSIKIA